MTKTTLKWTGTVCWDDLSIADVSGEALRERIAVIAQDHGNWPLTVRDNIVMGRLFDQALLELAAASSGADTVIAELDRGYDTLLARQFKDGAELSGGQWQRIAAARLLPHRPAADHGRADRRPGRAG